MRHDNLATKHQQVQERDNKPPPGFCSFIFSY